MDSAVGGMLWLVISMFCIIAIVYGAFILNPILGFVVLGIVSLFLIWLAAFGIAASNGYRPTAAK